MTNPDNVGWLPELPATIWLDSLAGRLYTADQMRAYGELCRAAPAGSGEVLDSWQKWPIINRLQMQANDCEDAADEQSDAIITALQLKAMAADLREAAALLRKLQQGAECFVREMRTSKGSEFFVVVRCNGRELTPHMYTERWKAEYDVASWQHLLCGAPEPDLLAYGPDAASKGQEGGK